MLQSKQQIVTIENKGSQSHHNIHDVLKSVWENAWTYTCENFRINIIYFSLIQ